MERSPSIYDTSAPGYALVHQWRKSIGATQQVNIGSEEGTRDTGRMRILLEELRYQGEPEPVCPPLWRCSSSTVSQSRCSAGENKWKHRRFLEIEVGRSGARFSSSPRAREKALSKQPLTMPGNLNGNACLCCWTCSNNCDGTDQGVLHKWFLLLHQPD